MSIPAFLSGDTVVIKRTPNGFAVCAEANSPVAESPVFETWAALEYYLSANFAVQSA